MTQAESPGREEIQMKTEERPTNLCIQVAVDPSLAHGGIVYVAETDIELFLAQSGIKLSIHG
jgi:hypothetical protein